MVLFLFSFVFSNELNSKMCYSWSEFDRVVDVTEQLSPDYDYEKLKENYKDTLLGNYIEEVEKQVKVTPQRGYFSLKKAVVASLAATFVLGTVKWRGHRNHRAGSRTIYRGSPERI